MELRIVLLPDERGNILFKQYSKALNQNFQCFFELGDNAIPHITLVHLQINESDFDKLKKDLRKIGEQTKQLSVSFDYPDRGETDERFIGIYKNDERILKLRDTINSIAEKHHAKISPFNKPHVTLTKLKNEGDIEKAVESVRDFPKDEIRFDRLAICETAEHGICSRILSSNVL